MPDESPLPVRIEPEPNPEEAAAIAAALEMLSEEGPPDAASLKRGRWWLAGLLGHSLEPGIEPEGTLWSFSRWGG